MTRTCSSWVLSLLRAPRLVGSVCADQGARPALGAPKRNGRFIHPTLDRVLCGQREEPARVERAAGDSLLDPADHHRRTVDSSSAVSAPVDSWIARSRHVVSSFQSLSLS